jgi:hypothetical protein
MNESKILIPPVNYKFKINIEHIGASKIVTNFEALNDGSITAEESIDIVNRRMKRETFQMPVSLTFEFEDKKRINNTLKPSKENKFPESCFIGSNKIIDFDVDNEIVNYEIPDFIKKTNLKILTLPTQKQVCESINWD